MNAFRTKILAATGGSENATLAARAAVDLSRAPESELHVVHVWTCVPSHRPSKQDRDSTLQVRRPRIAGRGREGASAAPESGDIERAFPFIHRKS